MNIGWFGYGGNHWVAEMYRDLIQSMGHKLVTCHEYPNANHRYNRHTINNFIDDMDVMLLPHREVQPSKSTNKLAISWARGKPCIVGERPAYLKYVEDKKNAVLFHDEESLKQAIQFLEEDENRRSIGKEGFKTAEKYLHPRSLIEDFISNINKKKPHVHVVIPHYSSSMDYLGLAAKSVFLSEGDYTITMNIVSSSELGRPELGTDIYNLGSETRKLSIYHQQERMSFAVAVNKGLRNAPDHTTHYLVFNDDAILSKYALANMVKIVGDSEMILNPWSNCDKGWLHNDELYLGPDRSLHPNMNIDQFNKKQIDQLFLYGPSNYTDQKYSGCNFCPLYCTLFSKGVLDKVGFLNEEFSNGGEDADFSYRARRLGIESYWTREAFVFHFGGKTRKIAHERDPESHLKEDRHNNVLLSKRWKKDKKRIAIWTGPAWEKWDMDSPYTTGIGGSETCAIRLAEHAASLGHIVTMYGDHDNKEQNGVYLRHFTEYNPSQEYWDLFIASRNVAPITEDLRAGKILVWCHDIWLLSGQQIPSNILDKVDKFVCLSPWHQEFFLNHHKIPQDKTTIIPNGVDTSIYPSTTKNKIYGKMHYSSSPDRGLDNLMYCLPFIKDHVPELHLDVYYGFHNWESAVKSRNNPHEMAKLEALQKQIEECKDFVNFKGRVNQKELAQAWSKAYIWGYPTRFTETYCCLPETKMGTMEGEKPILKFEGGDEITNGENGSSSVIKTWERIYSGDVVSIKPMYTGKTLKVTSNHPVLAIDGKTIRCKRMHTAKCKPLHRRCKSGKVSKSNYLSDCDLVDREYYDDLFEIEAKNLTTDHYVVHPVNRIVEEIPSYEDLIFDHKYLKNHPIYNYYSFDTKDSEFYWFLGLYTAEGSNDGRSIISLSLGTHETGLIKKTSKYLDRNRIKHRIDDRDTVTTVTFHDAAFARLLSNTIGRGARNKRVPTWISNGDSFIIASYLQGLFDGDGSLVNNTYKLEVGSEQLVYDVWKLLLKQNIIGSISHYFKNIPKRLGKKTVKSDKRREYYSVTMSLGQNKNFEISMGLPTVSNYRVWGVFDSKYVYLPIRKLETEYYEGLVYNLTLDTVNTYLSDRIVTHNCITANEAMLTNTPIVCSDVAALNTTVGQYGHRLSHDPYSKEGRQEFISEVVELLKNEDKWIEQANLARLGSRYVSWPERWQNYWAHWL